MRAPDSWRFSPGRPGFPGSVMISDTGHDCASCDNDCGESGYWCPDESGQARRTKVAGGTAPLPHGPLFPVLLGPRTWRPIRQGPDRHAERPVRPLSRGVRSSCPAVGRPRAVGRTEDHRPSHGKSRDMPPPPFEEVSSRPLNRPGQEGTYQGHFEPSTPSGSAGSWLGGSADHPRPAVAHQAPSVDHQAAERELVRLAHLFFATQSPDTLLISGYPVIILDGPAQGLRPRSGPCHSDL
jgi:hypothetical protein